METDAPNAIRTQDESVAVPAGSNPAEFLGTPSPVPPAKAEWSTLPPITFIESESPWRKINDQTVPLSDDNMPPAPHIPSDIFLG
ncbi:MAG: hypothetical protein ACP5QA_14800 [Phycisphaerae bacterium]